MARLAPAAVFLGLVAGATGARAEPTLPAWSFGIGLSYYDPAIGNPSSVSAFDATFGTGVSLLLDFRATRYLTRLIPPAIGTLGVEAGVGTWNVHHGDPAARDPRLWVLPIEASLVFRQASLWERFQVPLLVYLRGGLTYAPWWAKNYPPLGAAVGTEEGTPSPQSSGGSAGLHASAALAVVLDWTGRAWAGALGVPMLVAEVGESWVNNFEVDNKPGQLNLTSTRVELRLAVDL